MQLEFFYSFFCQVCSFLPFFFFCCRRYAFGEVSLCLCMWVAGCCFRCSLKNFTVFLSGSFFSSFLLVRHCFRFSLFFFFLLPPATPLETPLLHVLLVLVLFLLTARRTAASPYRTRIGRGVRGGAAPPQNSCFALVNVCLVNGANHVCVPVVVDPIRSSFRFCSFFFVFLCFFFSCF